MLYQFVVVPKPPKSSDSEGKPPKADPKRDQPTGDAQAVDDKTPVVRHG